MEIFGCLTFHGFWDLNFSIITDFMDENERLFGNGCQGFFHVTEKTDHNDTLTMYWDEFPVGSCSQDVNLVGDSRFDRGCCFHGFLEKLKQSSIFFFFHIFGKWFLSINQWKSQNWCMLCLIRICFLTCFRMTVDIVTLIGVRQSSTSMVLVMLMIRFSLALILVVSFNVYRQSQCPNKMFWKFGYNILMVVK